MSPTIPKTIRIDHQLVSHLLRIWCAYCLWRGASQAELESSEPPGIGIFCRSFFTWATLGFVSDDGRLCTARHCIHRERWSKAQTGWRLWDLSILSSVWFPGPSEKVLTALSQIEKSGLHRDLYHYKCYPLLSIKCFRHTPPAWRASPAQVESLGESAPESCWDLAAPQGGWSPPAVHVIQVAQWRRCWVCKLVYSFQNSAVDDAKTCKKQDKSEISGCYSFNEARLGQKLLQELSEWYRTFALYFPFQGSSRCLHNVHGHAGMCWSGLVRRNSSDCWGNLRSWSLRLVDQSPFRVDLVQTIFRRANATRLLPSTIYMPQTFCRCGHHIIQKHLRQFFKDHQLLNVGISVSCPESSGSSRYCTSWSNQST